MKKIGKWIVSLFMTICCIFGLIACGGEEEDNTQTSEWIGTYKLVYCNHEFVLEAGVDGITEDYYVLRIHENGTFYWFQMNFRSARTGPWEEVDDKLYLDLDYNGISVLEKVGDTFRFAGIEDEAEYGVFLNKEENIACNRENIVGNYQLKLIITESDYATEDGIFVTPEEYIAYSGFALKENGTMIGYEEDLKSDPVEYDSYQGTWTSNGNKVTCSVNNRVLNFVWLNDTLFYSDTWEEPNWEGNIETGTDTCIYVKVSELLPETI